MRKSIKSAMSISYLGIVLVFVLTLLMGFSSYTITRQSLKEVQRDKLENTTTQVAYSLGSYLHSKEILMEKMSQAREVHMYSRKFQDLPLVRLFTKFKDEFAAISYVNEEGNEEIKVVHGEMSPDLRDISHEAIFRKALKTPNKVVFSDAGYVADIDGEAITAAILNREYFGDEFNGMILTVIPLSDLHEFLSKIKVGKSGRIVLIDRKGRMLSAHDGDFLKNIAGEGKEAQEIIENAKAQKAGFGRGIIEGTDIFAAYAPVNNTEWSLLSILPNAEFAAPLNRLAATAFFIFIVIFIMCSGLALWLVNFISRPIKKLVSATQEIARGDFSKKVDIDSGPEMNALAKSFNQMIDELKETQEKLVRKEKLSVLGELSGTVGHELRNPLGVISNAVYFLKTVNPDADETVKEYLGIIQAEVETSQRIISDLLEFARTKKPNIQSVPISELVVKSLAKCTVHETVTVRTDLPETMSALKVDPLQIIQAFINIMTNAVQAMPEGGTLEIKAEEANSGKEITVSFTDTGEGISPDTMAKLFHPLFTTKARGLGLGLTASKNFITANGGTIDVSTKLGEGTTFTIKLPTDGVSA